jgi:DNA invertase Pin-like site-specific DNA recombinase
VPGPEPSTPFIVEAQDRLWRDQGEAHLALRKFRFWEVKVFDASTGAELTSKSGKVIATVIGLKDEIYLDDLADKTRRGMLGQVQRGFSPGGRPYGYHSDPITDPTRTDVYSRPLIIGSRRVIDPDQAEVVRGIYEKYASGWSSKRIAAWLNEQRIPPPRVGQRGWTYSTISGQRKLSNGILRNPIYAGWQVWNRVQKMRDPETGKRVWRRRPPEEWVHVKAYVRTSMLFGLQCRLVVPTLIRSASRNGCHGPSSTQTKSIRSLSVTL